MNDDNSRRLAIVDDDGSVRRALKRLLTASGFEIVTHDSGPEFLESRMLHEVECILLDVHMPRMSGIDVLAAVRDAATKVPVVLMSGRYESDFAERALEAGASAVLRKPFSEEDLLTGIALATGVQPAVGF